MQRAYNANKFTAGHAFMRRQSRKRLPPHVFFRLDDMAIFHVVHVTLHIEQREQGDGAVALTEARIAIENACELMAQLTRRRVEARVILPEPIQIIELDRPEEKDNDA